MIGSREGKTDVWSSYSLKGLIQSPLSKFGLGAWEPQIRKDPSDGTYGFSASA